MPEHLADAEINASSSEEDCFVKGVHLASKSRSPLTEHLAGGSLGSDHIQVNSRTHVPQKLPA